MSANGRRRGERRRLRAHYSAARPPCKSLRCNTYSARRGYEAFTDSLVARRGVSQQGECRCRDSDVAVMLDRLGSRPSFRHLDEVKRVERGVECAVRLQCARQSLASEREQSAHVECEPPRLTLPSFGIVAIVFVLLR